MKNKKWSLSEKLTILQEALENDVTWNLFYGKYRIYAVKKTTVVFQFITYIRIMYWGFLLFLIHKDKNLRLNLFINWYKSCFLKSKFLMWSEVRWCG